MHDIVRAQRVFEEVARKEGVPVETVIENIEYAIADAIRRCSSENNEEALVFWSQIPRKDDVPTPHELLVYLGNKIRMEMK